MKGVFIFILLLFLFLLGAPKAEAALPTFVSCGAVSGNAGAITLALPASIAANDILLMFLETAAQSITVANQNGGTWAEVTNSPQTAGSTTRLTVFWSRYNGTQGNPVTSDSGDHQVGAICAYNGVVASGNPWDITSGDVDTTSDNSGSIPGATTSGPDRLVVIVGAADDDADTPITAVSNSDLANISASRVNAETNQGNDGGLTVFDGEKAAAGSYGATTLTYTAATTKGMMTIALKPPAITTIGDGTDPGNVSIAPGASATDLDAFTLQASEGADTVTAATVTLVAGSSGGLSLVAITNNAGSTTYCSQSNPSSDTISLTTCGIPVSTSLTTFKVRITPKSHANMPAPPGSTYTVTGTVTSFTSTNSQSGSDTDSATVTIDNASPANVTSASGSAGDSQVSLTWTNPADSDFHSTVVLRRATSAVADTPVEGTTYIVGNTIGTATVACVVASPTSNCTDTGLTNGTAYHYKIFSRDTNANYATGVVPAGSPVTPADTTAPAAVSNLAVTSVDQTSVSLSWTAPGDDGSSGTAATYDVRYSASNITAGNFSSATEATGEPTPSIAGSSESMTISGLSNNTLYYFALKTSDEVPNTSGISNVVSTTTLAGAPTPVTTITDGTDPGNVSIAPGASATDLDAFTLQASEGADTVTAATVTLVAGSSGGLSLVAITNNAGSTTYCSQANPASDTVSLTSCGIPVTTSQVQFKVRITPKSHANMPAPPGSTYTVTGTVTSFTSTNSQSGSDTDSATVTIDNASPANVTSASGSAGDSQVSLTWTNPADSDFHSTVVLRRATSAVADTPVEGTTYIVGNTIGTATVACVVASPTSNCTDTGLTNGTAYHYKIFSRDINQNYATGVVPTGSPVTPAVPSDTTAPADISNLAVTSVDQTSVSLSWTAPGDDGSSGTATTYDVRHSMSNITAGNFGSATQATGEPSPSAAGSFESMTVSGLSAGTTYYFAIKATDESLNSSAISNVVSTSTSESVSPPSPEPEVTPSVTAGGVSGRLIKVFFSGKAYPNSRIEILRKDTSAEDVPYLTVPLEIHKVSNDGSFELSPGALRVDEYFFALRAEDKDGRKTNVLAFSVDLRAVDIFEAKDILMPPTIGFEKMRIRKGDSMKIMGYASLGSKTEIEIDGKIVSVAQVNGSGFYVFATTTSNLALGNHYARTRQVDKSGIASEFSATRTFQISQLFTPKADFNNDERVNITDLGIFLFRWNSKDQDTRLTIDMNVDGKIDIKDFSIFLKNIQK